MRMSETIRACPPALQANHICKRFGSIQANDSISLRLEYGTIHALVGENGAGKSTFVNILYGLRRPDSGAIEVQGTPTVFHHPTDAIRSGIGLVQQHFTLIPAFTVLENLTIGNEDGFFLHESSMVQRVRSVLECYRFDLPLRRRVESLPVAVQQQVEIAKWLCREVDVLLLDEPTAALAANEIEPFLDTLQGLRRQGLAILFITHRLAEAMRVADTITVLRKGRVVLSCPTQQTSVESIASAMAGEPLPDISSPRPPSHSTCLQMKNVSFCVERHSVPVEKVTLEVFSGEILGITGVAGNGQEELIDGLLGHLPATQGSILLDGVDITHLSPAERKELGIAYIPQDRLRQGLLPRHSITENYMLNRSIARFPKKTFKIDTGSIDRQVRYCIETFQIQVQSPNDSIDSLSGGHQQRVVISRELMGATKLILAYNPTRGLDMRATRFVHNLFIEECKKGTGILLFSSEWNELFLLCHRIAVMYRGCPRDVRVTSAWNAQDLCKAMTGISQ